jgi:hypothetical protein
MKAESQSESNGFHPQALFGLVKSDPLLPEFQLSARSRRHPAGTGSSSLQNPGSTLESEKNQVQWLPSRLLARKNFITHSQLWKKSPI